MNPNRSNMAATGLPPKYASELTKLAKKNCKVLLASSSPRSLESPVLWASMGSPVDGVQMYSGQEAKRTKAPPLNYICGVALIYAPLNEVVHAYSNMSRNPYFKRFVDNPVVIDSRTLYDMDKRERRSTSIVWTAIRSTSTLMQHRDFVVLQHQDEFPEGPDQPRSWVSCLHSVNLPMVPPFDNSYVRGGIYSSGYVFRETQQPGVTEAVIVLKIDFKGYVPRVLCTSTLKSWAGSVGRMALYFHHHRRQQASVDLVNLPRVHHEETQRCSVCHQPFGLHTEKESCRKCHERICSNCSTWAHVELEVVGVINVMVCKPCAENEPQIPLSSIKTSTECSKEVNLSDQDHRRVLPSKVHESNQNVAKRESNSFVISSAIQSIEEQHKRSESAPSPSYSMDIPMRMSAVTWMDTLTKQRERNLHLEQETRPRHGSLPQVSDKRPKQLPHRHSISLSPKMHMSRWMMGNGPKSTPHQSNTTLDPFSSIVAQASGRGQEFYDEFHQSDKEDDACSVIEAFTSTGSVLDLNREVKSFRL